MQTTRFALLATATLLAGACGDTAGPAAGDVPDREVFVATYVDLRVAAIGAEGSQLTDEMRTDVLTKHGVTEDQLYAFVERYGTNLPFMRDVWNDVEVRLEAQRSSGTEAAPEGRLEPSRD